MSPAPGRRFRPRSAADAASDSWQIVAALGAEWVRLDAEQSTRVLLRQWARRHPALIGFSSLADLLDGLDAADRDTSHAIMLALLRAHRQGSAVAGHTIVQAMLPKACSVATSTRGRDVETKISDAVSTLWETLAGLDLARPPGNLPAHLGLEMLHAVTAPTRAPATEVPTDDVSVLAAAPRDVDGAATDAVRHLDGLDADSDLATVLAWSIQHGLIRPDDAAFLRDSTGGGLDAAARQRRSRLTRRLRQAVEAHLAGSVVRPVSRLDDSDAALLRAIEAGTVSRGEALLVAYTTTPDGDLDASGVAGYARRHGITTSQVRRRRAAVLAALRRHGHDP